MTKILLTRRRAELRYDKDVSVSVSFLFSFLESCYFITLYYLFCWWRWGCWLLRRSFVFFLRVLCNGACPSKDEIEITQMISGREVFVHEYSSCSILATIPI